MEYRTPLAKVRGLGSAKSGSGHWWMQRVTAVALLPLTFWLLILMDLCFNASFQETREWLSAPLNTSCIIAWLLAVFYHAALGIQVVIEDYISTEWLKIVSIWSVNLVFLFLGLSGVISVFRIILAG